MMSADCRDRISKKFISLSFYAWFIPPISFLTGILPTVGLVYGRQYSELKGRVALAGISAMAFMYGILFSNCLSFLLKELKLHIDRNKSQNNNTKDIQKDEIHTIYQRLKLAEYAGGAVTSFDSITTLAFCIPTFYFI